jgi:TM2 domain-containing membrane protein YozV
MGNSLIKSSGGRRDNVAGVIPAACSAVVPGLGQLLNGDTDKAIGVFVVAAVSGASLIGAIPIIGSVADGFLEGRKKR